MHVGFIGLGNVGAKLCGSLLDSKVDLSVIDLDKARIDAFCAKGASTAQTPAELAEKSDAIITCLPNPAISNKVVCGKDGVLESMMPGKIWMEMSTTDMNEVKHIGRLIEQKGADAVDCPVSGGCHRAKTGNISIFAGCKREVFERVFPLLKIMGRRILHTGDLGSASVLKVITNYLATVNLVSCAEALCVAKAAGMDLRTSYEAIRISSGNSFVHETESQVILNGSRDINFTMDLVLKDISIFQMIAERAKVDLELSPKIIEIFKDGIARYGEREFSPNIIKRLEEATKLDIRASGFPAEIIDDEPKIEGYEVKPQDHI